MAEGGRNNLLDIELPVGIEELLPPLICLLERELSGVWVLGMIIPHSSSFLIT